MVSEDDLIAAFNHHQDQVATDIPPSTSSASTTSDIPPSTSSASTTSDIPPSTSGASATSDIPPSTSNSNIEQNQDVIKTQRKRAREAMIQQAERMVKRSRIDHAAGNLGDNVTVPLPLVDRGWGDL